MSVYAISLWQPDTEKVKISFTMGHERTTGTYTGLQAKLDFDPMHPELAKIEASIDATSLNTGDEEKDHHLNTADFFRVQNARCGFVKHKIQADF